jgi:ankyrin repeat protein
LVAGIIRVFGEDIQKSKSWCSVGHEEVVRLLLDKGADVNVHGGACGNALHAASEGGHEAVVKMLLEKGADVNAEGGYYGNALRLGLGG